jgi:hypothetical protein
MCMYTSIRESVVPKLVVVVGLLEGIGFGSHWQSSSVFRVSFWN